MKKFFHTAFFLCFLPFLSCSQENRIARAERILEENKINLEEMLKEVKEGKIPVNFKLFAFTKKEEKEKYLSSFYQNIKEEDCKPEILGYRKKVFKQIDVQNPYMNAKEQREDAKVNPEYYIRFKYCAYDFDLKVKEKELYLLPEQAKK